MEQVRPIQKCIHNGMNLVFRNDFIPFGLQSWCLHSIKESGPRNHMVTVEYKIRKVSPELQSLSIKVLSSKISTKMSIELTVSLPACYLLLGSLPLLVLSEHKSRSHAGTALFKMLSSIAFLAGPLLTPMEWSTYHRLITAGLLLSMLGDFFLIPSRGEFFNSGPKSQEGKVSISFQLGVVAFAAAHIAYIIAFFHQADENSWGTFATMAISTLVLAKWLGVIYPPSHSSTWSNVLNLAIARDMKPLVLVYAVIISLMFAAASSTIPRDYQRVLGAGMFVISDVFVAMSAFQRSTVPTQRGWVQIAVGYGLYFGGQIVIAGTVEA